MYQYSPEHAGKIGLHSLFLIHSIIIVSFSFILGNLYSGSHFASATVVYSRDVVLKFRLLHSGRGTHSITAKVGLRLGFGIGLELGLGLGFRFGFGFGFRLGLGLGLGLGLEFRLGFGLGFTVSLT